jgi:hypothetical protein
VQKRFAEDIIRMEETTGYVRMVVLKARQQGLSTVISAWQYFRLSQRKASEGSRDGPRGLSTRRCSTCIGASTRTSPTSSSRTPSTARATELVFDKLDSALRVATAGGRGVARGETLTVAHLSEVAFWPTAFANANFNGLVKAVPEEPKAPQYS